MALRLVPVYDSYNSSWVMQDPANFPILSRDPVSGIHGLGYQAYPGHNSVKDPASLGGRWFGKSEGSDEIQRELYDKEYKRYIDKCNSVPDYIIRNLKEMPSNKGYIWKGLWCFGELPREENANLIMFKKEDNDLMEIHEIDNNFHYIYEKIGKNRKTLLYKIERNKKIQKYLLNQNI